MADFQALIEKEHERLTKLADDYHAQIAEIQGKLAEVHREMRAITAYEEANLDKPAPVRTPRTPRGSKRDELIALIRDNPNLSRGDILAKLDIVEKDNKAGVQSVSNTLANLKKAGTVLNEGGKYRLAPT